MNTEPLVLLSTEDHAIPPGVAVITLNRPEARNALSQSVLAELVEAMLTVEADDNVAAAVLTGNGTSFCAGLDLKEMAASGSNLRFAEGRPWPTLSKPLIAAVNGPAYTGGLELALSCDFIIASTKAEFADTHTRVGIVPFWGMSVLLPAAVGSRTASYMSLTGRPVGAEEAQRMGLVAAVVDAASLLETALSAAADIANADVRSTRVLLNQYRSFPTAENFARELEVAADFFSADEFSIEEIESRRQALMARRSSAREKTE